MSFDFSTLVTDRTQSDVQNGTKKGYYNAEDLNRVTECMDYLAGVFQGLGYAVPGYQKIEIQHYDAAILPDGYTELEYIESNGTQYVNVNANPDQNTEVICDFALTSSYSSIRAIFGVRDTSSGTAEKQFVFWNNGASSFRTDYFGTQETLYNLPATERYVVDKKGNVTSIGQQTVSNTLASGRCEKSLFLFCVNDAGSAKYFSGMKIFDCTIKSGDDTLREFIPCKNPDGSIGLYDIVSDAFYGNSGSGEFTAGPEIPRLPAMDPYTWYDTDVPTVSQMAQYLANVQALQDAITGAYTVSLPSSMALLTYVGANNIEQLLEEINAYLTALQAVFLRSGMAWAVSGGPGFYFSN